MQEIVIHNWDELQRAVFDDVWDEKVMRYRDNRIYRGTAESMAMLSWQRIPESGSCFRLLSITVFRQGCWTGHIRLW